MIYYLHTGRKVLIVHAYDILLYFDCFAQFLVSEDLLLLRSLSKKSAPCFWESLGGCWQRPQQAVGGGEEVDGGGAVRDEGGFEAEGLQHFHLNTRRVGRSPDCSQWERRGEFTQ